MKAVPHALAVSLLQLIGAKGVTAKTGPDKLAKRLESIGPMKLAATDDPRVEDAKLRSLLNKVIEVTAGETPEAITVLDAEGAPAPAASANGSTGKGKGKAEAKGKSTSPRKPRAEGPSNKEVIYKAWQKAKDKGAKADQVAGYLKMVSNNVKDQTIRSWISGWGRGQGLPACAKK